MPVLDDDLGGYQPFCADCGVKLCYSISELEYSEMKKFWDNWRCLDCNPNAKGSLIKERYAKLSTKAL